MYNELRHGGGVKGLGAEADGVSLERGAEYKAQGAERWMLGENLTDIWRGGRHCLIGSGV